MAVISSTIWYVDLRHGTGWPRARRLEPRLRLVVYASSRRFAAMAPRGRAWRPPRRRRPTRSSSARERAEARPRAPPALSPVRRWQLADPPPRPAASPRCRAPYSGSVMATRSSIFMRSSTSLRRAPRPLAGRDEPDITRAPGATKALSVGKSSEPGGVPGIGGAAATAAAAASTSQGVAAAVAFERARQQCGSSCAGGDGWIAPTPCAARPAWRQAVLARACLPLRRRWPRRPRRQQRLLLPTRQLHYVRTASVARGGRCMTCQMS